LASSSLRFWSLEVSFSEEARELLLGHKLLQRRDFCQQCLSLFGSCLVHPEDGFVNVSVVVGIPEAFQRIEPPFGGGKADGLVAAFLSQDVNGGRALLTLREQLTLVGQLTLIIVPLLRSRLAELSGSRESLPEAILGRIRAICRALGLDGSGGLAWSVTLASLARVAGGSGQPAGGHREEIRNTPPRCQRERGCREMIDHCLTGSAGL
nr:hypothetical protein [Tanacetum cinerariifolium]